MKENISKVHGRNLEEFSMEVAGEKNGVSDCGAAPIVFRPEQWFTDRFLSRGGALRKAIQALCVLCASTCISIVKCLRDMPKWLGKRCGAGFAVGKFPELSLRPVVSGRGRLLL